MKVSAPFAPLPFFLFRPTVVHINVVKDLRTIAAFDHQCHTVNRNWWNAVMMNLGSVAGVVTNFGAGYISLKQPTGTVGAIPEGACIMNLSGPVNTSARGIVVGTGTGAESFEGYALGTQCVHGTGANQLSHGLSPTIGQSYSSGPRTWTLTVARSFTNGSGSQIDVAEVAMYAYVYAWAAMVWRDLLGAVVPVPINAVLTVSYPMTLTLPA